MKNKLYILLLASLLVTAVSCRKESEELFNPNIHYCRTFTEQFKTVWSGIDHGYVFWAHDTVDWDAVYERMLPVFQDFDNRNYVSDAEFTAAYESMLKGLLDHHMSVQVKNLKTGHAAYLSPAQLEVPYRDYYHGDFTQWQVALLPNMDGVTGYKEGGDELPCWFALFPGNNGKKIAYLRFKSFSVMNLASMVQYGYAPQTSLAPFKSFYGTDVTQGVTNGWAGSDQVEGVIIDVRGNHGGQLADLMPLVGSMSPTRVDYGYSRIKEGLGRLDYGAWLPMFVESPQGHLNGDKKVVVLSDVNSISCAEITSLIIKMIPNGTMIGERTYGATGPLIQGGFDYYYSGVFGDYNKYGYYVYTSNYDVVDLNYETTEGVGIIPDIECIFDFNALQNGHDNQLERALEFIRTGK